MSLGNRIRFFRKRKGLSQFELETEINASPGVISRIENESINPTKETILKIAECLELNIREVDYLIGITSKPVTEQEIELAKKEVSSYFKRNGVAAYLLDEKWRFMMISDFFIRAIGLTTDEVSQMIGKTTAQVIVDPELPIIKNLSEKHLLELLNEHLNYYYSQVYFMFDDPDIIATEEAIMRDPIARDIWLKVKQTPDISNYRPQEVRKVYIKFKTPLGRKVIPMYFNRERLLEYSRFEVVEYYPENKFLNMFKSLI